MLEIQNALKLHFDLSQQNQILTGQLSTLLGSNWQNLALQYISWIGLDRTLAFSYTGMDSYKLSVVKGLLFLASKSCP